MTDKEASGTPRYTPQGSGMVSTFKVVNGERVPSGDYVESQAYDALRAELAAKESELQQARQQSYSDEYLSAIQSTARNEARGEALEHAARLIEKRAEDRVHSTASYDSETNAWEYPKHAEDVGNSLDEEADDCAAAIRALKDKPSQTGDGGTPRTDAVIAGGTVG